MCDSTLTSNNDTPVEADHFISNSAKLISQLHRQTTRNVLEIGRRLNAVKALMGHGGFGLWIRTECGFSERTATRYMNAAKAFESNSDTVAEISISLIHALSSPKMDAKTRRAVLADVQKGTVVTARDVKAAAATDVQPELDMASAVAEKIDPKVKPGVSNARITLAEMIIVAKTGSPDGALGLIEKAQLPELRDVVLALKARRAKNDAEFEARQLTLFPKATTVSRRTLAASLEANMP